MHSRGSLLFLSLLLLGICSRCCPETLAQTSPEDLTDLDLEEEETEVVEYMDPTPPQAFPNAEEMPSCSAKILQHDFAHTVGSPPVTVNYSAPANCKWNRAVLEFSASCDGEQNDRVAAVWLDGVELLRTSTAKPTTQVGVFWRVRKDITHFASLLVAPSASRNLSVMLENTIDDYFRGVYRVNITIDFYGRGLSQKSEKISPLLRLPSEKLSGGNLEETQKLKSLLERPADLIMPVSNRKKGSESGYWFRIDRETEIRGTRMKIPRNVYKAVLEVCVSSHGDDEFWFSNPPDSYHIQNNIPSRRGNWAFRELIATVDGLYAGSIIPFPVVFPGAVNPLFWTPVVAIKAFDMPTYDLDLTPFLGQLLNGRTHTIGIKISHAISFWMVNANLHLWLDPHLPAVPAMMVKHHAAPTFLSRNANHKQLDGHYQLEAARQARFEGWARSSIGNFSTLIDSHFKYKSSVEYKFQGTIKEVYSQSKSTTDVRITEHPNRFLARVINQSRYPVKMLTSTAGVNGDRMMSKANITHMLYQFTDVTMNQMRSQSSITDLQMAGGWLQVNPAGGLSGGASTLQTYQRRDNGRCHTRKVGTVDRGITIDQTNTDCNAMIPEPSLG